MLKYRNIFSTITPRSITNIIEAITENSLNNRKKYAKLYLKVLNWMKQMSEST
jgi:hypothetical protein